MGKKYHLIKISRRVIGEYENKKEAIKDLRINKNWFSDNDYEIKEVENEKE